MGKRQPRAVVFSKPSDVLVLIDAPHFVAGLLFDRITGRCVQAAPILSWCEGTPAKVLHPWITGRGWDWQRLSA